MKKAAEVFISRKWFGDINFAKRHILALTGSNRRVMSDSRGKFKGKVLRLHLTGILERLLFHYVHNIK